MARLFPSSRYGAYPMPLHRAAGVKSLVNGQMDDLRNMIFRPQARAGRGGVFEAAIFAEFQHCALTSVGAGRFLAYARG